MISAASRLPIISSRPGPTNSSGEQSVASALSTAAPPLLLGTSGTWPMQRPISSGAASGRKTSSAIARQPDRCTTAGVPRES